jgi:regulator of protease activity HflC (stomatin/prohibitin superfamily)
MSPNPSGGDPAPSHWPPMPGRGGRSSFPQPSRAFQVGGLVVAAAVVALLVLASRGGLGMMQVEANEIAVRVNYLTGEESVITQPGYQFYFPFVQGIYTLDRTTQEYVMSGLDRDSSDRPNQARRLTVRAKDGSNFWFQEMRIQYELIPNRADRVVSDSGVGDAFKQEWIKAHARSVLRDEFGRYSAVEVANPTVYKQAPEAARERLNSLLEPHGIRVVRIVTPNPKFDDPYERAIEDRNEADQEVEELKARAEQLQQVRGQRLAAVSKEKEVEMQTLEGELSKELLTAERDAIRIQRGADAFAATRVAEGQAELEQLTAQAQGLTEKYTKEAEGIASRAKALEQRGEVVVREALVEKLLGVKFTFVPYSRDPAPERLEHSGTREATDSGTLSGTLGAR